MQPSKIAFCSSGLLDFDEKNALLLLSDEDNNDFRYSMNLL